MANKTFTVTRDHIKLVRGLIIEWNDNVDCALGVPSVDGKRPYGNSNISKDVAEIIELDFVDEERGLNKEQEKYCIKLHKDMAIVLQIVLSTGAFKTGDYECNEYETNWRKVKK